MDDNAYLGGFQTASRVLKEPKGKEMKLKASVTTVDVHWHYFSDVLVIQVEYRV